MIALIAKAGQWQAAPRDSLGKLPVSPRRFRDEMQSSGTVILSVRDEHVLTMADVAASHPDPFDRLLLGVAQAEDLTLLTADAALIDLAGREPRLPVRGV